MSPLNQQLQQAIAAAKAGNRTEARRLLTHIVQQDSSLEEAWVWLAAVVDAPEQQRHCLSYALTLNPHNVQAQKGLAWLRKQQQPSPPLVPPAATQSVPAPAQPSPPPAPPAATQSVPAPAPPEEQVGKKIGDSGLRARLYASGVAPSQLTTKTTVSFDDMPPVVVDNIPTTEPQPEPHALSASAPSDSTARDATTPHRDETTVNISADACPYCGATTSATNATCLRCHKSLLIRAAPRPRRSVALSFMGGMWGMGSFFVVAVCFILIGSQPHFVLPLIIGIVSFGISMSLLLRFRWAYSTTIVLFLLLIPVSISYDFWLLLLPFFILLPRSYRDFYGRKQRFVAVVQPTTHEAHFEAGLAYREQGMWYMAAKEWEAALRERPDYTRYLETLGVAYIKLAQWDDARNVLHKALALKPNDTRLQQMLSSIDAAMAKK